MVRVILFALPEFNTAVDAPEFHDSASTKTHNTANGVKTLIAILTPHFYIILIPLVLELEHLTFK
jgi:hypothetical protein